MSEDERVQTHRMPPRTRARRNIPARRVPLRVGHSIVVRGAKVLDASAPVVFGQHGTLAAFVLREIEVPELQLGLR